MPVRFLLAPSADLARHVLATEKVLLAVEAEYGSFVAEGRLWTAAHHQPAGSLYAGRHVVAGGRSSPCNDLGIPLLESGVVLISHFDLDTVGGCLRALPGFSDLFVPKYAPFWSAAEQVDVTGAHKLVVLGLDDLIVRRLRAFWAWSKALPRYPRDRITDVTEAIEDAGLALRRLLHANSTKMLEAGDKLKANEDDLNLRTFRRLDGSVIVRVAERAEDFCNALYTTPDGALCKAVAAYNRALGSVTISLCDPVPGVSCRQIVQALWGPEAGGHDGIAGSPREKDMGEAGLEEAVRALRSAIG